MPFRTITATPDSRLVPGSNPSGFAADVSLTNTGTAPAYVDTEQQAGPTAGYPLSAGSTLVWQAGRPLWLTAPTPTTVTITENAGALFDAGAVAGQILAQGLAQQIAQQISVTGAPPIDQAVQLLDWTTPQDGSTTQSATIDTSSLGAVRWRCRIVDPATLTVPGATVQLGAYWYDDTLTTLLAVDYMHLLGDNGRWSGWEYSSGQLAVKGPRLVLTLVTPARPGGTVQLDVHGTLRPLPDRWWTMNGYYGLGGGGISGTVVSYGLDRFVSVQSSPALAAGQFTAEWVPTRSGLCTMLATYNAAVPANGLDFLVQDFSGVPIAGVRAAGGGGASYTLQQQFYMPARPVQVFLRNKGAAALTTAMQVQLTWGD